MIQAISNKIYQYILKHHISEEHSSFDDEWIRYGLELMVSAILGASSVLLIALLFKKLIEGIIFLIIIISTRQYIGGYHADTYLKCNLCLIISFISTLVIPTLAPQVFLNPLMIIIPCIESILIIIFCPIKNKYKPIKSNAQYIKCKLIGSLLFLFYLIIGLLIKPLKLELFITILSTLQIVVVLGVIGYFKERSYKHEKNP